MDDISSSSGDHLPDEIIELILSRCPAESVGRFTSVSKTWQSIISNPRFRRIHLIQQSKLPENQNMFLFWMHESYESRPRYYPIYMKLEDAKFEKNYPKYDSSRGFSSLSACDGLILLQNDLVEGEEEYMLWNPLIGKDIIIPAFTPKRHPQAFTNRPHDKTFYAWLHRLYFDSITNDLVAYQNWYALYSCHNGIWGELKDFPLDLHVNLATTFVDGCIYYQCNGEIMCFDTRDGKLHEFPLPNDVEGRVLLTDISGRLCVEKWSKDDRMEKNGSFEKSWRKLISMEKEEADLWNLCVICLTNEDDVVLSAKDMEKYFDDNYGDNYGSLYEYKPRVNCFQKIKSDWNRICYNYCFPYSKNLYIPSSDSRVLFIDHFSFR